MTPRRLETFAFCLTEKAISADELSNLKILAPGCPCLDVPWYLHISKFPAGERRAGNTSLHIKVYNPSKQKLSYWLLLLLQTSPMLID